nr:unnamed protein product [Callosobruchus analis]
MSTASFDELSVKISDKIRSQDTSSTIYFYPCTPLFHRIVVHLGGNIPYFWIIAILNGYLPHVCTKQLTQQYCTPRDAVAMLPLQFQRKRRLETAAPRSDGTAAAPDTKHLLIYSLVL